VTQAVPPAKSDPLHQEYDSNSEERLSPPSAGARNLRDFDASRTDCYASRPPQAEVDAVLRATAPSADTGAPQPASRANRYRGMVRTSTTPHRAAWLPRHRLS